MDRIEVARILEEIAAMLELKGENPFKVRAYDAGARAIRGFTGNLAEAVRTRELLSVPGIGSGLFSNIATLLSTGSLPYYDELSASFPPGAYRPVQARQGGRAFRLAAASLSRSRTALGAFYRRIKARSGAAQAVTATAHKLARIYYAILTKGTNYIELGQQAYEQRYKERRIAHLRIQAKSLGFQLVPSDATGSSF